MQPACSIDSVGEICEDLTYQLTNCLCLILVLLLAWVTDEKTLTVRDVEDTETKQVGSYEAANFKPFFDHICNNFDLLSLSLTCDTR